MARYTLPTPLSMYRDTGLVEITKEFRNRYVQNMAADNALAKSIMEMDSMEEDQEAKQRLMEKYNLQLEQRAASGNYHLLGNQVVRDAQNFMKDYNPIRKNKANYDAWLKGLTDSNNQFIKTGKGVDPFTYKAKIAEAKYNYGGLEFNPDGSVVETSMFNGPSYVGYVDVESRIIEQMKDVVMTEIDTTGIETPLDENMQIIKDPNSTAYYVKQGEYTKKLDPNLVASVVTSVLNQPDTKAYTNQTAYLENFTKDRVNPNSNLSLATEEINNILSVLDAEISALEKKKPKNKEEKAEIEQDIEAKENLEEFILESREANLEDLNILVSLSAQSKEQNILNAAITKYAGVKSKKIVRDYTESSRFNQRLKQSYDDPAPLSTYIDAGQIVVDVFGGKKISDKRLFKNEAKNVLDGYLNKYGEEIFNLALTANTAKERDDLGKLIRETSGERLDNSLIDKIIKDIQRNNTTVTFINDQINEATMATQNGQTQEELNNSISEEFSSMTYKNPDAETKRIPLFSGADIMQAMKNLQLLPANATMKDALDQIRDSGRTDAGGIAITSPTTMVTSEIDMSEYKLFKPISEELIRMNNISNGNVAGTSSGLQSFMNTYDNKTRKIDNEINKVLDAQITTDALLLTGYGDKTGATAKAFKDYFQSGRVPSEFQFTHEGDELNFKELQEEIGSKLEILPEQSGLLAVSRPDGKPMLSFAFKVLEGDNEGDVINKTTPAATINNDVIRKYISTDKYKVESLYRSGLRANRTLPWAPPQFDGSVVFHYDADEIEILGTRYELSQGLLYLSEIVERKGIILY